MPPKPKDETTMPPRVPPPETEYQPKAWAAYTDLSSANEKEPLVDGAECLEVGLNGKSKSVRNARQERGIESRQMMLRVYTKLSDTFPEQIKVVVACHKEGEHFNSRSIPIANAYWYPEFYLGMNEEWNDRDKQSYITGMVNWFVADWKENPQDERPSSKPLSLAFPWQCVPILTVTMMDMMSNMAPHVKFHGNTATDGSYRFLHDGAPMSSEQCVQLPRELKAAHMHMDEVSTATIKLTHRTL
ncbi:uncharacterized protein F5Z01DRAFT_747897 [Emericellopsis atlantica]|uniref:Uncharacterized protein n=1 Tax=Emericellopsis atlantica TaxID=2614577 RepID=A0A9P7ZST5_9HYPO|nr:uncharacterized protein F5Z01DRAFT_747897 [Emericellopsis atlantica]KAG9257030.1 hypothetical protein F5Z01DRAFT_747897 [Emericellopsis atlantica]